MAKSYMAEVAALLGVELGEQFKVKVSGVISKYEYVIKESGLYSIYNGEEIRAYGDRLESLLTGEPEVVKLLWKPKRGETYYCWTSGNYSDEASWNMGSLCWDDESYDIGCLAMGNCFKTEAEAMAHKDEVIGRYNQISKGEVTWKTR